MLTSCKLAVCCLARAEQLLRWWSSNDADDDDLGHVVDRLQMLAARSRRSKKYAKPSTRHAGDLAKGSA